MKTYPKSANLFERAKKMIPGGVNSPVRACRSVGTDPLFIDKALGSKLIDADGNEYIDYIGSWGPMILGHSHPSVISAIEQVLKRGTSFGAPVDLEVELAELVLEAVPAIDKVRMVSSGTEATMSAIRVARGVTGRNTIIKFDGCYHGHADSFLVSAGSGVATLGIAGSPGVPESVIAHTMSLPYNDMETFTSVMDKSGDSIAAVIVEAVAGNMGLVPPADGFLETLRIETSKHGTLLIFDEVMTGFRVSKGGAQGLYNIDPDMSCFGKIVGGGLPVGAYGGKEHIMSQVAPEGPIYQAGTLSGNPIAMAAGIATLKEIGKPGFYEALERTSARLAKGLQQAAVNTGTKAVLNRVGSMVGIFLTDQPVGSFDAAKTSDLEKFASYYRKMLDRRIYLAPSQFESLFVSAAHSDRDIDDTVAAAESVFSELSD
ncbi:MAG: glutamate-1-semialdehyde 2,1-aminomutase [Desulfobacteraceae bacterium]|jgi:glutamate-1-semialdehyde 2,1-aminomutase|nr:glutamate-1-semialdehyde 2,1-aminomutase [Desulfobacteraceae bacterium]